MVKNVYNYLNSIKFTNLINWNIKHITFTEKVNNTFNLVEISKLIKRVKKNVEIKNEKKYKRITIKTNCGGIFIRDTELGENIKTKNQYIISSGQLLISKIDARNGAFGIAPIEVDNAVITGNFWTFDIDCSMIEPEYLLFILSSDFFIEKWFVCSNGSGNRLYLQEKLFLKTKIPLPSLELQKKILFNYNNLINKANEYKLKANELETSIDNILFNELGIEILDTTKKEISKYIFLRFTNHSSINNRWEIQNGLDEIYKKIKKCKYEAIDLYSGFDFVNRSWLKKKNQQKEFNYVEIGDIDPNLGIISYTSISVNKAPSRATQVIKTSDLIIGTTRPYLKKFAIVGETYDDFVCSSGFQVIKDSDKYNLEYLINVLKSEIVIKQFEILMTGALYPAINQEQLKSIVVPLPPLEIQNEIANKIKFIKADISNYRTKSTQLKLAAKKQFEEAIFGEIN